jgi:NAD(P)-dependent dehydrogenase (short-subunit alcohol dehydrogenase family)
MIYVAIPAGKTIVGTFNVPVVTDALFCPGRRRENFSYGAPKAGGRRRFTAPARLFRMGSAATDRCRRQQTAVGRNGRLDDLIWRTVFLASNASGYVTGQTLAVDGGFTAK